MLASKLKWLTLFVLVVGFFGLVFLGINAVLAADRTTTSRTTTDTTATVVAPTCRDTDGGDDVYVKGTLSVYTPTYGNQTVVEACADTRTMDELVCLANDPTYAYTHKKTSCANGCSDGVCLKPKTCSETDSGNDKMLKGTNTIYNGDRTVYTTGNDYCFDKNTVAEFTCNGGQWDITYEDCGDGYTCDLGACVVVTPVVAPVVAPVTRTAVRYDTTAKSSFMAPSNNATLTNFPREAELQWTPITSASKYEVEVACDVCGSTRWEDVSELITDAVYITTPALAGDNQFRARVRAVYPDNTYSQWSDYLYFSYKTTPTQTTPTEPVVTEPVATEPAVQPVAEPTAQPTPEPAAQPVAEPVTEPLPTEPVVTEPAIEERPVVVPRIKIKKVGRMSCGNSAGGDGLYSACVKDTIKLDNKINITVRTYSGNYAWLTIKGAKKAYYRVKLGDSINVVSKNGKVTINVTYVKKSPKFGVFLQIETAE